jgi:hypothetical protein
VIAMKFRISSEFGVLEEVRNGPHSGIDFSMPEGTQLRSIFDGVVEQVFDGGRIGKGVKIRTEEGQEIIYGHMSKVDVHVGEKIHTGEQIGLSGNTGNSTGPHLHFGMKDHGQTIDPTDHADAVADLSGSLFGTTPLGDYMFKNVKEKMKDSAQEHFSEVTKDIIYGVADGLRDILVDLIGSIALVGGGVLIILRVAGYDKGYKWAGVLFVINILVKYLLGG